MNNTSLFELTVDKPAQTVTINMEFDAELDLVWDAFTKAELLDQWYAPKPMTSFTKHMDFKVGGHRFYAMRGADGFEMWALQKYTSITPKSNFKFFNVFADKDENPEAHGSDWSLNFSEVNGITHVTITIYNESLERMERVLEGFRIGMSMTYENLKELLQKMSN